MSGGSLSSGGRLIGGGSGTGSPGVPGPVGPPGMVVMRVSVPGARGDGTSATVEEVAEPLSVPTSWVRESTRSGAIPHVELGRHGATGATTWRHGWPRIRVQDGSFSSGVHRDARTAQVLYVRGGRLRRPPRGRTYQRSSATAMTAAATATTATVEAATIMRGLFHCAPLLKRRALLSRSDDGRRVRTHKKGYKPQA